MEKDLAANKIFFKIGFFMKNFDKFLLCLSFLLVVYFSEHFVERIIFIFCKKNKDF